MVHKKYIKKGGKVFGPYLYENYRDKDGITRTNYLGVPIGSRIKKNLLIDKKSMLFLIIALLILISLGIILEKNLIFNKKITFKGELQSQKAFLDVFVRVIGNSQPRIIGLEGDILICENNFLDYSFNVTDSAGDALDLQINPIDPFYVYPTRTRLGDILTKAKILTLRTLNKRDINLKRIGNEGWGVYKELVSASDGLLEDHTYTNITIIEINNLPQIENIGVRTLWTKGKNSTLYYKVKVFDKEDGSEFNSNLNVNISFLNSDPFFNISKEGIINFSASQSLITSGTSSVYYLSVCANDSGLKTIPHANISLCLPEGNFSLVSCNDFSLTITMENRIPEIINYYPLVLNFSSQGNNNLYFNITTEDPDGNIPDIYWYVDNETKQYKSNNSFDEFAYSFGCDVSGKHVVKALVTDGLNSSEIIWNISVQFNTCGSGGSSGGGGGGGIDCKEKWVCMDWSQCENLKKSYEADKISKIDESLIKKRCENLSYSDDFCGFQKRNCFDAQNCKKTTSKPGILRECYYTKNPNCDDKIRNCHNGSCETLTDCGGPCSPCPSCDDGIKNQEEKDIDCGGPCEKCIEKPKPVSPVLIRLLILLSLTGLLVLFLILAINEMRKYEIFKRFREKKAEKVETVFLLFAFVFIIIMISGFLIGAYRPDKIMILNSANQEGALASYGLGNILIGGMAKLFLVDVIQAVTISLDNTELIIWDDTHDSEKGKKYSFCSDYCSQKNKELSDWNIYFYANYTQEKNPIPDPEGSCYIKFEDEEKTMEYNPGTLLWEYNRSFNKKGNVEFNITCESSYAGLSLKADSIITNTEPYIMISPDGYIKANINCTEDIECYYDFKTNISEDDSNDVLRYGYDLVNTTLTNFTLDSDGILSINVRNSRYTGDKKIELNARDSESSAKSAFLRVGIEDINDAPEFVNLENKSMNMSEGFNYTVYVIDEENNIPFTLNITFKDCLTAEWSDRGENCILFDENQYNFDRDLGVLNINFTPSENDVGFYTINFSVADESVLGNKATNKIVNFSVFVINKPPVFTYVCDNERIAFEDSEFRCWINATDIYEVNNLNFSSDAKWFLDSKISECNLSREYKAGVEVIFTPKDVSVGNWSINISVRDTGIPVKTNLTRIDFFVENKNDSVSLGEVGDMEVYSGNNYQIEVNASDDDLKIPVSIKGNVYQENLVFSIKDSNGNDLPWIRILYTGIDKGNGTAKAYLNFSADKTNIGMHTVNLEVHDTNYYSSDSKTFLINIIGNDPPLWKDDFDYDYTLNEDEEFSLDLRNAVEIEGGENLTFSFDGDSGLVSFNLNSNGIIQFTPSDEDIGYHEINMIASDGKTPSYHIFKFSVENVNDLPKIKTPLDVSNATRDPNSNIIGQEDNLIKIFLFIEDNDFVIPSNQKSFYDEALSIGLRIEGNNNLFSFVKDDLYPNSVSKNLSKYDGFFIPRKLDIGKYNVTINVSDKSGFSDTIYFNLTITPIEHNPHFVGLRNFSAKVNEPFSTDINADDLEDGNDSSGKLHYDYTFLGDGSEDFIMHDNSIFNAVSGEMNYVFSEPKKYHVNITVTDSSGLKGYGDFWIFAYGDPSINYPGAGCKYSFNENVFGNVSIRANHDIGDNLTYEFYLDNDIKDSLSYYGDNRGLVWIFKPNFSDESYGNNKNLSLFVLNPVFRELNDSIVCETEINHTNAPVVFNGWIGDKSTSYNNQIAIDLKDYFSDIDHDDPNYNETIQFSISSNNISQRVSNWILYLSSSRALKEKINIIGKDSQYNATSNNFTIEFTEPVTITQPQPSSGGGGGGGGTSDIIFIKLIFPGKVSSYKNEKIDIPLSILNLGTKSFSNIRLNSYAFKDGISANRVRTSLSKDSIKSLNPGASENLNLSVYFENSSRLGDYDVYVNLSSESPRYGDWGKIQISLQAINDSKIRELLKFTEELIAKNPECIEIKEMLNEAKTLEERGDYASAKIKTEEAVEACKKSISQVAIPRKKYNFYLFGFYLFLTIISSFIIGIIYYLFKIKKIKEIKSVKPDFGEKSSYS